MEPDQYNKTLIGFGNIHVNFKREHDDTEYPYVIGAHGYCLLKIQDNEKFSSRFGKNTSIESNKIRKSTIGLIKQLCSKSLSDYCVSNSLTPSAIQSKTDEISKYLLEKVSDGPELESFGLAVTELVIESISVNEPDEKSDYEIVKGNSAAKIISAIAVSVAILAIALIAILPSINNHKSSNTSANETDVVSTEKETTSSETTTSETTTEDIILPQPLKYGQSYEYGTLKLRYDFEGWCVYECKAGMAELSIPDKINGIPVYRIDNEVFKNYQVLERIELPDTLQIIGNQTFAGCTSLKEIVFPDSLLSIGEHALSDCYELKTINIPEGVTNIGHGAFFNCKRLASVNISSSVVNIGDGFVSYCGILEELTVDPGNPIYYSSGNCIIENETKTLIAGCNTSIIPDDGSVKIIGDNSFVGFDSMTSVTIPEGVETIGQFAFTDCRNLRNISLPSSIKEFGEGAVYGCESIKRVSVCDLETWLNIKFVSWSNPLIFATEFYVDGKLVKDIVIPDGTDAINDCMFDNYDADYTIVIPDSVKSIGMGAFYQSDGLHNIVIPDSVKTIGKEAFWCCDNLSSIVLGSGLTSIDENAFIGCDGIKTIYYTGTEEQFEKIHICLGNDIFNYVQIVYNYQPE